MAKKPTKKPDKKSGSRGLHVNVKTAKKRSNSSARWLARQLNDPYVTKAKQEGYRSRAAFKLLDLDEKFHLLSPGMKIIDLGCAPGGWSQVAVAKVGASGKVVGCDLLDVPEIPGATLIVQDFLADEAPQIMKDLLGGKANLVMSDMAANTTGHTPTDHLRIMNLCEVAYYFACEILEQGGSFVCKVLKGGTESELLKLMQRDFATVKHAKPKSSRADSAESYVVAMGFRGAN
ncbi:MAG: RlmE family RNA methyltransferase [Rickettsiales bacterium]